MAFTHRFATIRVLSSFLLILSIAGCGSGRLTQEDMIRMAKARQAALEKQKKAPKPQAPPAANGDSADKAPTKQDAKKKQAAKTARTTPTPPPKPPAAPQQAPQGTASRTAAAEQAEAPAEKPDVDTKADPEPVTVSESDAAAAAPPLSETEKRQQTIDRLGKIGQAIKAYIADKNLLPASYTISPGNRPLLSWRVELLPYLGYQNLYERFDHEEPWDSPTNLELLPLIPEEFRSPDRNDARTNYLGIEGTSTAFRGAKGLSPKKFEDLVENTLLVVEADERFAVEWTKPGDLNMSLQTPYDGLGTLRENGFFALLGCDEVRWVPAQMDLRQVRSLMTIDGGEVYNVRELTLAASADARSGRKPSNDSLAQQESTNDVNRATPNRTRSNETANAEPEVDLRRPLPTLEQQDKARNAFREVYLGEYNAAKTPRDKRDFARKMFGQAKVLRDDTVGQYVLLDIAQMVSIEAGDSELAIEATQWIIDHYLVDEQQFLYESLTRVGKYAATRQQIERVIRLSMALIQSALRRDDFKVAEESHELALVSARKLKDRQVLAELDQWQALIQRVERAYRDVEPILKDMDPAKATEEERYQVGQYLCFVKEDWTKGLPLLKESSDLEAVEAATLDITGGDSAEHQLRIGHAWWTLAKRMRGYEDAIRRRAAYWYEGALPLMGQGFERIQIEHRIEEVSMDGVHLNSKAIEESPIRLR